MGHLVWAVFTGAFLPDWDSIKSIKLDLGFRCIPILSSSGENGGSRSGLKASGDKGQLKASNSSSNSNTLTTSSLSVGLEVLDAPAVCWKGRSALGIPFGID